MRSLLAVDGSEGPDSLADLISWLNDETLLRGRVRPHAPVPRTGELGGWTDIVVIAVGAGGALTTLARALSVYLQQPRRSTVRVKVVSPDCRRTEVTVEHTKDLTAV
ncbi:effector-associated constant component EACC1 [Streptomyces drozdowiczii]|uniref:effector-associated constant component EACC1 n=1 Tax=Streptomyces drozdowiczii TaxID=202862 RepID=UPI00403C94DD